jgi:NADH:ubiquinone oxidoreductase subunit 2 (subunit N)
MSEWLIFAAGFGSGDSLTMLFTLAAALNVVLALAYYTPLVSRLYRDRGDPSPVDGRPLALSVRLPLLVLAALTVVLGVWPSLASGLTAPAAAALLAAFGA